MSRTLQQLINSWRILVGEIDPNNSRWQDDPHGIFYVNEGRREFAKKSSSIIGEFRQLTQIGATIAADFEEARYALDPLLMDINRVEWNGRRIEKAPLNWDETTGKIFDHLESSTNRTGIPFAYRRIGNSIDLFLWPDQEKSLVVIGPIMTTDLPTAVTIENELTDDQAEVSVRYAAHRALTDDGRDGRIYLDEFTEGARIYRKRTHPTTNSGPMQSVNTEWNP